MSNNYSVPTDEQLWKAALNGEEKPFELLFSRYYDLLVNYGSRFTNDIDLIREAVQSLFIKIWNNRATLRETPSVKYYLIKSFRRILIRIIQSQSYGIRLGEDAVFGIQIPHEQKIISREISAEQRERIERLLSLLTNRQREAIYLRFYENLSYEEIAEILGMQVGGTYKLIYRALDRLREGHGISLVVLLLSAR